MLLILVSSIEPRLARGVLLFCLFLGITTAILRRCFRNSQGCLKLTKTKGFFCVDGGVRLLYFCTQLVQNERYKMKQDSMDQLHMWIDKKVKKRLEKAAGDLSLSAYLRLVLKQASRTPFKLKGRKVA